MAGFECPFCGEIMSISPSTRTVRRLNFSHDSLPYSGEYRHLEIEIFKCPNDDCGQHTVFARGRNNYLNNVEVPIYPRAVFENYPEYVPEAIRNDYEEACAILHQSPKAAATLARRCLQGMIHDFWNIHAKNLNQELSQLKEKVPAAQWRAINALRTIGNIGAHMEHDVNMIVDIDANEAEKLILLIEHLIEKWYIDRHDAEELYAELEELSEEKTEARKG